MSTTIEHRQPRGAPASVGGQFAAAPPRARSAIDAHAPCRADTGGAAEALAAAGEALAVASRANGEQVLAASMPSVASYTFEVFRDPGSTPHLLEVRDTDNVDLLQTLSAGERTRVQQAFAQAIEDAANQHGAGVVSEEALSPSKRARLAAGWSRRRVAHAKASAAFVRAHRDDFADEAVRRGVHVARVTLCGVGPSSGGHEPFEVDRMEDRHGSTIFGWRTCDPDDAATGLALHIESTLERAHDLGVSLGAARNACLEAGQGQSTRPASTVLDLFHLRLDDLHESDTPLPLREFR